MQRGARTAKGASPDAPEAAAPCKEFERLETAWYTKRLPNLAANMRLVIAVFDRSGPGLARGRRHRRDVEQQVLLCGSTNSEWLQRNRGHEPHAWLCCSTCGRDHGGQAGGLAGQSGDTASAGSHSCMVRRERPLALRTGIATAATQPPSDLRSHAIWRASIEGSTSSPAVFTQSGSSSFLIPVAGKRRAVSTRTCRSSRNRVR